MSAMDTSALVPGTDQTIGDLMAAGYSSQDIATLYSQSGVTDIPTTGLSESPLGPSAPDASTVSSGTSLSASGQGSILAGITDIFQAVGTGLRTTLSVLNPPKPVSVPGQVGSYVFNPQTGQYMPAVQGTQAVNFGSLAMIGILIFGAWLLVKAAK